MGLKIKMVMDYLNNSETVSHLPETLQNSCSVSLTHLNPPEILYLYFILIILSFINYFLTLINMYTYFSQLVPITSANKYALSLISLNRIKSPLSFVSFLLLIYCLSYSSFLRKLSALLYSASFHHIYSSTHGKLVAI